MDYAIAVTFAVFVWWLSTGAVLYLLKMPSRTFPTSLIAASATAGFGLFGLWVTSDETTVASAFCGFSCALVVWAWHEISFLTGHVTGPRVSPCAADREGQRFLQATQTLIYHEIAILLTAVAIVVLTWRQPNQFGTLTFVILWLARLSAKLNIFFGVPNITHEFLPRQLDYLKSYFRDRPMNLLFPVSITASTVLTWVCIERAIADDADAFLATGWSLLATLMFLVIVEHWFLVLPLRVAALWNWDSQDLTKENLRTQAASRPVRDETETSLRPIARRA